MDSKLWKICEQIPLVLWRILFLCGHWPRLFNLRYTFYRSFTIKKLYVLCGNGSIALDGGFSKSKQDNHYNVWFSPAEAGPRCNTQTTEENFASDQIFFFFFLKNSLWSLKNSVQKCRKLSHRSIILRKELVPGQEDVKQMGTDIEQAKTWSDRRTSSLPGQEQDI